MKTIVYILLGIFVFGIVAQGFTKKSHSDHRIVVQANDSTAPAALLSQSAKIISDRLKDYSTEKFVISISSEKQQIQVDFTGNWDLKAAENLMVSKGLIQIYETYNRKSLVGLLHGDTQLLKMLNSNNSDSLSAELGCISQTEVQQVDDYIKSLAIIPNCKFVWRQDPGKSRCCLYSLRTNAGNGSLLKGADIESARASLDKTAKLCSVDIRFKKSAIETWATATRRNINNSIAIAMDDEVLCAPVVRSEITGGSCNITGDFTENEVKYIAALGNNGALPLSFRVIK